MVARTRVSNLQIHASRTFADPVSPTHCRTVPANGLALPSSPLRSANTTDEGTGKKVIGLQPLQVPCLTRLEIHA